MISREQRIKEVKLILQSFLPFNETIAKLQVLENDSLTIDVLFDFDNTYLFSLADEMIAQKYKHLMDEHGFIQDKDEDKKPNKKINTEELLEKIIAGTEITFPTPQQNPYYNHYEKP